MHRNYPKVGFTLEKLYSLCLTEKTLAGTWDCLLVCLLTLKVWQLPWLLNYIYLYLASLILAPCINFTSPRESVSKLSALSNYGVKYLWLVVIIIILQPVSKNLLLKWKYPNITLHAAEGIFILGKNTDKKKQIVKKKKMLLWAIGTHDVMRKKHCVCFGARARH